MTAEATSAPKDPSAKPAGPAVQAKLRAENLERIASANLKADIAHAVTMGVNYDVDPAEVDAATDGTPINPSEPVVTAEPAPETTPVPTPKHRIKVHGKEMELTLDELITRAQKVEAADQYLVEAAQAFKAARIPSQAPAAPPAPAPEPAPAISDEDRALARALQVGSEEDAVAAIRKLRATALPTNEAETRLLASVDDRLNFRDAATRFQSEYKDIWEDPYLRKLAIAEDEILRRQNDPRSYHDRFIAIGMAIREWKGKLQTPAINPDKLTRKATVTVLPTAAGRAAPAADVPVEDPSATIAEMAKARQGRKLG